MSYRARCQHTTWDHVNGHRNCPNPAEYISTVSHDLYCPSHYSIGLDVPIQPTLVPAAPVGVLAGQESLW